ncbi:MAG: glycosyltransferase, partial [Acidimicrobiia bacterium]
VALVLPKPGVNLDGVYRALEPRPGLATRLARRMGVRASQPSDVTERLAKTAVATGGRIFVPTDPRALPASIDAAERTSGVVSRTPKMPSAGSTDLIDLAPTHPELATPPAGLGQFHTPADHRSPYVPEPGRHSDRSVILCYRKSEVNPGRYLEEGLRRSGAKVRVETESIDLSRIEPSTDLVVFVEGPYPSLTVTGSTEVPIVFWFHHGEHHLHANLRLTDRYRADAVLMAHSWHLAYWSPAPVHRFPFGVATELLDPSRPLSRRSYDVAMVGAKLRSGGPYDRRQQLVASLEEKLPTVRLGFKEQVSAEEMADLYADSRIVINEGGTRHYPITMRVLEAVGSGAVLLSDRLPGMEMLLEEGSQFALLGDDVVADVTGLLDDSSRMESMARSALERAMGLHTYDHRVDELFEIASGISKRDIAPPTTKGRLATVIDADVEVQRVAQSGAHELSEMLPGREVWDADRMEANRLAPGKMETVAIRADDVRERRELLRSARRYLYIEGRGVGLEEFIEEEAPQARVTHVGPVIRVDLMAPSYRIMDFEMES